MIKEAHNVIKKTEYRLSGPEYGECYAGYHFIDKEMLSEWPKIQNFI